MDKIDTNEVVDDGSVSKISVIEEALLNNVIGGAGEIMDRCCCCCCGGTGK